MRCSTVRDPSALEGGRHCLYIWGNFCWGGPVITFYLPLPEREKNLTFNQTIEKLEKENKLLNEQNQKLINEHEKVFNISFDAILNERGTKDSPLMKKVKEEVRGGSSVARGPFWCYEEV